MQICSMFSNLKALQKKVMPEVNAGRMSGSYLVKPISILKIPPIGLIPKRTGGFQLITNYVISKSIQC